MAGADFEVNEERRKPGKIDFKNERKLREKNKRQKTKRSKFNKENKVKETSKKTD